MQSFIGKYQLVQLDLSHPKQLRDSDVLLNARLLHFINEELEALRNSHSVDPEVQTPVRSFEHLDPRDLSEFLREQLSASSPPK